jgi:AcrR family transcriptional regulator
MPQTRRGWDTYDVILAAARRLASDRWVEDVSFVDLATEAGVARASLLHLFPHWRNVLWELFEQEADFLDNAYEQARRLKREQPNDRVYAMLADLLNRAEKTGLLYPNLRGALFTWHGEPTDQELSDSSPTTPLGRGVLAAFALVRLQQHYVAVEDLLGIPHDESLKPNEVSPVPIGECLVNFALDLAAGSPTHFATFAARRRTLRSFIELVAAGLRETKPPRTKTRRG